MSTDIVLVLCVLAGTVAVLASRRVRMDLVALIVMVTVSLLGLVSPERAIAGFASPAVIAVGGMFVVSAGLSRTGVARLVGRLVLRWAGAAEGRIVVGVTLVSGAVSGVMNNVGVAAMMLPVALGIAKRTDIAPSKLLIPMALGAQLGGFTTLIGTAPNLLAAASLADAGLEPFGLFTFTPIGMILLVAGTVLIAVAGPRLLPSRTPLTGRVEVDRSGIREDVDLRSRLFYIEVPARSALDGKTLAESLIDSALGLHVLAIQRGDRIRRAPGPDAVLKGGDRVLVQGSPDHLLEVRGRRHLVSISEAAPAAWLRSDTVELVRARVPERSRFVGKSASDLDLNSREGIVILALRRAPGLQRRTRFLDADMRAGDELLIQAPRDAAQGLVERHDLEAVEPMEAGEAVRAFDLEDRLWSLRVTEDSALVGRTLRDSRLGDAVGFMVVAVGRDGEDGDTRVRPLPDPDEVFRAGDELLVKASVRDMVVLRALQRLLIDLDSPVDPSVLEGDDVGFAEAVLAPRSELIGRTLRQVSFQGRFGMHVVAIVRESGVVETNLRDEALQFGDALLLYGPHRRQRALANEPDLILLQAPEEAAPRAPLAARSIAVTVVALAPVMLGWVPVAVGVITGAVLMILSGCLSADQAYRAVDWPTLVLVAGMLSLGAALEETGAVALFGEMMLRATGTLSPHAVLAFLVVATGVGGQIMPGSAVIVLMAPVAINAATHLDVSPYPLVMAAAIAATSLASPVSQPAHALVMTPAGYRMGDYLRLGIPMTVLVLVLTILVTPVFLPF
ncbi:MAG: SLC13 family permease [Gemmatimonadota bacterium]|nr:SLC13 family permease [Gemmatimonadota bacterium]